MIIAIPALLISLLLLYMWYEANQNNIVTHTIPTTYTNQYHIAFISDVHARKIHYHLLQKMRHVDAVIIGGDFCDKRTPIQLVERNLQTLATLGKIYYVWGNNDREIEEAQLRALFKKYHVTVLENESVMLQEKLWLCAIEDTSTRKYSFEKAFASVPQAVDTICVSHNPGVFNRAYVYKPTLLLGGHWHGGQIRLGPYGMRPLGYTKIDEISEVVSNGYGTTLLPLRLFARPEVHLITLHAQK
ncbi:metallophosphoesterase [Lysinibacillus alkalisoli]|uniref:Metallophosphoesterase n=1 Tax=Lysinibacillus alkalisoli TaxID=1911548 RepID=A0A917G187_9BACI|nr:metallophosphoesterase family protein [Lysinibacillus alkalisoli]GGG17344.1 metallophosphoesterase [Lysinibacillus alkalisoli]